MGAGGDIERVEMGAGYASHLAVEGEPLEEDVVLARMRDLDVERSTRVLLAMIKDGGKGVQRAGGFVEAVKKAVGLDGRNGREGVVLATVIVDVMAFVKRRVGFEDPEAIFEELARRARGAA